MADIFNGDPWGLMVQPAEGQPPTLPQNVKISDDQLLEAWERYFYITRNQLRISSLWQLKAFLDAVLQDPTHNPDSKTLYALWNDIYMRVQEPDHQRKSDLLQITKLALMRVQKQEDQRKKDMAKRIQIVDITTRLAKLKLADQESLSEPGDIIEITDLLSKLKIVDRKDSLKQVKASQAKLLTLPDELLLDIMQRLTQKWCLLIRRNEYRTLDSGSTTSMHKVLESDWHARPLQSFDRAGQTCRRLANIAWTAGKESFNQELIVLHWHEDAMAKIRSFPHPITKLRIEFHVLMKEWNLPEEYSTPSSLRNALKLLCDQGLKEITVVNPPETQRRTIFGGTFIPRMFRWTYDFTMLEFTNYYRRQGVKTTMVVLPRNADEVEKILSWEKGLSSVKL